MTDVVDSGRQCTMMVVLLMQLDLQPVFDRDVYMPFRDTNVHGRVMTPGRIRAAIVIQGSCWSVL